MPLTSHKAGVFDTLTRRLHEVLLGFRVGDSSNALASSGVQADDVLTRRKPIDARAQQQLTAHSRQHKAVGSLQSGQGGRCYYQEARTGQAGVHKSQVIGYRYEF